MRTLPLFAAGVLVACASIDDIRQAEPIRSGAFAAGFKDMAACIVYETAPRYAVSNAVFERAGRAVLTYASEVSGPIGVVRNPIWEMTILDGGAVDRSRVELRMAPLLDGGSRWVAEIWPVVEECASTVSAHLSLPQR